MSSGVANLERLDLDIFVCVVKIGDDDEFRNLSVILKIEISAGCLEGRLGVGTQG